MKSEISEAIRELAEEMQEGYCFPDAERLLRHLVGLAYRDCLEIAKGHGGQEGVAVAALIRERMDSIQDEGGRNAVESGSENEEGLAD